MRSLPKCLLAPSLCSPELTHCELVLPFSSLLLPFWPLIHRKSPRDHSKPKLERAGCWPQEKIGDDTSVCTIGCNQREMPDETASKQLVFEMLVPRLKHNTIELRFAPERIL